MGVQQTFATKTVQVNKVNKTTKASFVQDMKKAAVVGATVLMVNPAFAATIKLGGDNGELVNNKAFPHNVVFDEDAVPDGVDADKISHEDYLNGPGEKVSNKFDTAGTYEFYCEPHHGAGMQGKIVVN